MGNIFEIVARRFHARGFRAVDIPIWILGMLFVLAWASPFLWMVSTSFKYPADVLTLHIEWIPRRTTIDNFVQVFKLPVLRWALNSTIQAVTATFFCVIFGAMAGFALACMRFPGRNLIFTIFLASLMVPTEVSVVPMLLAFLKLGWASSYQALILPMIANVLSLYIFRQFFLTFPQELLDAARMDGANVFRTFWLIAFPLARAPMVAAAVIIFTLNWNNFLWPLLITFDGSMKTLPVGIAQFAPNVGTHTQIEGYAVAMAAITLLSIPTLVVFFFLQKQFISGISQGGIKQ